MAKLVSSRNYSEIVTASQIMHVSVYSTRTLATVMGGARIFAVWGGD